MESIIEASNTRASSNIVPVLPSTEWIRLKTVVPRKPPISSSSGLTSDKEEKRAQQEITAPVRPNVTWGRRSNDMRGLKNKTRIFNGAILPRRPEICEFQSICGQADVLLLGERLTFTADPLSVPLIRRQAFNVLFSGYNDLIHDGLLSAILASLSCSGDFDEIVYFNGRGIAPVGGFTDASSACGERFKAFNDIGVLPLQEIADNIAKRRIALIVDGLDAE